MSRAAFEIEQEGGFESAVKEAAIWMRNRCPGVPRSATEGTPFRVAGGGQNHAEAIYIEYEEGRLWSSTLDVPDPNPRRTWVTEITVGEHRGKVAFGARLLTFTRGDDFPYQASRPSIVRQILSKLSASADGENLSENPWLVNSDYEFEPFFSLLTKTDRALPIVVFTRDDNGDCVADPVEIANKLSGLAHIVELDQNQSWNLTRRLGKRLSVFGGAARVYRAQFTPDRGNSFDQRLWLLHQNTESDEQPTAQIVSDFICSLSVRPVPGTDFPRFAEVQRIAAEKASEEVRSEGAAEQLVPLYEEEIKNLKNSLDSQKSEFDELLAIADAEREKAVTSEEEIKGDLNALRVRLLALEEALRAKGQQPADEPLVNYENFEDWADRHLGGSIWIAPKALKETEQNGQFRDPQLVGRTLLLLRDFYVPMRRAPSDAARQAYENALKELRLIDAPSMTNRDNVRADSSYSAIYRTRKYWCEDHIKFGGGTDPRAMFRIYYCWHKEDGVLLIGHMPSHLNNSLTN